MLLFYQAQRSSCYPFPTGLPNNPTPFPLCEEAEVGSRPAWGNVHSPYVSNSSRTRSTENAFQGRPLPPWEGRGDAGLSRLCATPRTPKVRGQQVGDVRGGPTLAPSPVTLWPLVPRRSLSQDHHSVLILGPDDRGGSLGVSES